MIKTGLATLLYHAGAPALLRRLQAAPVLTVLAYHRVYDLSAGAVSFDPEPVSASPAMFERQLSYIAQHFSVIDLATLEAFIVHGQPLPPHPLLITFDDGYLDNYTQAYPALRALRLPAVIFLTVEQIGRQRLAWWDECAWELSQTRQQQATLPLLGPRSLASARERRRVHDQLLSRLKQIPETHKQEALRELAKALAVEPPTADVAPFMNWDQVRELVAHDIACQSHTLGHPILTRVSHETVRRELAESRQRIEAETGQRVSAFAYPNGQSTDYDPSILQAVRAAGYTMAFTLTPGPVALASAQQRPLEIPRVFVRHQDSLELFALKAMGLLTLGRGRVHAGAERSEGVDATCAS